MKNFIIGLLIGTICIVSINATVTSSNSIPQPRAWVVDVGSADDIKSTIMKYSKEGYIVHQIQTSGYSAHYQSMVVMYKYY